ncbi:MAG: acyl-CoA dehydrogenase family protein [Chloroflexi bacterium]|nr:acyl-CoA dehydrogenase family protein [Chloroflexota bacterium]
MSLTAGDALGQARRLAAAFRQDAADRDLAAGTPKKERDLIRASGLLNLSVPTRLGGLGASWPTLLRAVREIATADASLAHLFGYHHLGLVTPHLIGTPAQRDYWYAETARRGLFWGNSLNPLDPRTTLVRVDDDTIRLNGEKSFCTGAADSDVLLVSAAWTGVDDSRLQVAVLPTRFQGITVRDDWDNMGQRQTDSGSVAFHNVVCHADDFLGPPGAGGSVWATLRPCVTQSILSNIFLGLAQGALLEARQYTLGIERPFAGTASRPCEDAYVLEAYGEMHVQTAAAEGLLDRAADALQVAWEREYELAADERGACAAAISIAKAASGRAALEVTSQVFEVMGARATSARYRFDRFWRNARTLTLHDPLNYKIREVGDWFLNGRYPAPSFYS